MALGLALPAVTFAVEFNAEFLNNEGGAPVELKYFENGNSVSPGTYSVDIHLNQILLAQRIDQHLAEQIPSHMLPSQLHVLPALPRNDNGKLARAELRHLADTLYHDNLPEERAC